MPDDLLLPLTDTALKDCRAHIGSTPDIDLSIVGYLTRHVAVLMCAEVESVITKLIENRIDLGCDDAASNLVKSVRGGLVRNAKFNEIGNRLSLLGDDTRKAFEEMVEASAGEEGVARLGMTVRSRDEAAHMSPPNITFDELDAAYEAAAQIVEAAAAALKKTAPTIA